MEETGVHHRESSRCGNSSLFAKFQPSTRNPVDISNGNFPQADRQFESHLDRQSFGHQLKVRFLRRMWLKKPRMWAVFTS
jgi:hypothetical protein